MCGDEEMRKEWAEGKKGEKGKEGRRVEREREGVEKHE